MGIYAEAQHFTPEDEKIRQKSSHDSPREAIDLIQRLCQNVHFQ